MTSVRIAILAATLAVAPGALAGDTQPVERISALIDEAAPGDTVVVPPGVYEGHLRISKPVTLDGAGAAVIDGGGEGTVVELLTPEIIFRGFTVRASGANVDGEPAAIRAETGPVVIEGNTVEDALFGIDLRTSSGSVVRNNRVTGKDLEPGRRGYGIRLWWSHDCTIERNTVSGSRDMVFWYSENLSVRDNLVTDSRYGLHFMYSHETTLERNTLRRNSVGVYLMYSNNIRLVGNTLENNRGASGYGIGLKDCDGIVVDGNRVLANRIGVYLDNSPSSFDGVGRIEGNLVAYNEIGALATPITHGNTIVGNAFVENEEQVGVHGRGALADNAFAEAGRGNFWSDYAGFDADGDGVGDIAHAPRSLFESLIAREPNLRLFVHSPAQQAIEFTARALPEFRPDPKFTDPAPLAAMPDLPEAPVVAQRRAPIALTAFGLLGAAGALVGLGARQSRLPRTPTTGAAAS
ncbi:MAG: nitrous oxide reductase family maturation protein NosD [Phycisphaerales bacterium]